MCIRMYSYMYTWYTEDIFKTDVPQIDKVTVYPVIFKTAL